MITREQYNEWRNHPATMFFRQFIKDKAEFFKEYATNYWLDGKVETLESAIKFAVLRGQTIELIEMSDVPYEHIETFYKDQEDARETDQDNPR